MLKVSVDLYACDSSGWPETPAGKAKAIHCYQRIHLTEPLLKGDE